MSVPTERGVRRAETQAAEPPLEPPVCALQIPRIAGELVGGVFGGGAHGELVHVRLADDHGVRRPEPFDTWASYGGRNPCNILLAHVVGWSRVTRHP